MYEWVMSQLVFCSNSFSHQTQLQVVVCVHNPWMHEQLFSPSLLWRGLTKQKKVCTWRCQCNSVKWVCPLCKSQAYCEERIWIRKHLTQSSWIRSRFSVYQLSLLPVACCVLLVTRCGSACSLAIVLEVGMVPCMQPHFRPGTWSILQ